MHPPATEGGGPEPRRILRGTELRYALIRLLVLNGRSTVPQLIAGLTDWGFTVEGQPSKTVSDALRWERRRGRVLRRDWGVYSAGDMLRSTEHRIIRRVMAMRRELSIGGGQQY